MPQGLLRRLRTAHGGDVDQLRRWQYQYLYLQRRHRERHRRRFTDPVTLAGRSSDPGSVPARPHNFVTDIVVSIAKTAFDLVNCEFWLSGGGPDHDASCQTAGGVVSGGGLEGGGLGAAERGAVGDAEGAAEGIVEGDAAAAAGAGAKAVDEAASDVADLAALKRANAQARAEEAEAASAAPSEPQVGASGTEPPRRHPGV